MMNKTLLSLAVLAASTGALAQSSVTLYGTVEAGVGKYNGSKVGMTSGWQPLGYSLNTSDSFIGFRGTEDLGGGLKAGFVLEQAVDLRNGGSGAAAYQRASNVWLGGNWGTFRMGRAYSPSRNATAVWDVSEMANNSPMYHRFGAPGTLRNSSQFSYRTPDLAGFSGELGYVFKADNGGRAKVDLGLTYVNGPLRAGAAYNKEKNTKASYAVGAQYQFGMFALAAGYHHAEGGYYIDDQTGQVIPGAVYRGSGVTLGGKVNFGAASLVVNVARDTKSNYLLNGVDYKGQKVTNGLIEGRYALSKRTFVYANYLRFDHGNNYSVGMRHDF